MSAPRPNASLLLRVELLEVSPTVWRTVLVPESLRLDRLASVLLCAMGWSNSHLHQFIVGDTVYGMALGEDDEDEIDESTVTLAHALTGTNAFAFEYDFGDGWVHGVGLEARQPHRGSLKHAVCLAGESACPPEDSGGPSGYERFLEALTNPQNEDHEMYVEWNGGPHFDPREFNLAETNVALQGIALRSTARHRSPH